MKNDERWLVNYDALKAYVLETGHFPNKHDKRLNWYKYNAKLIKQGKLSPEREQIKKAKNASNCHLSCTRCMEKCGKWE